MSMIHLTKEGNEPTPEEVAERAAVKDKIFNNNIVINRDFTGVMLSPDDFQEFQKIVNERRPYNGKDFIPQTFIPNLRRYFEKGR
jgi:hypothetical protein